MAADADSLSKESSLIQVVSSDELDADFVEQRIQESTPKDLVTKGFCAKCQHLFDNWPTLGDSSTKEHDSGPDPDKDGWENAAARSGSTFELEGSARSGCRFCTFLLQSLKDSNVLDIFRKVEVRLYHLGEDAMASLSIQNWGSNPSQLLWMNFPGKVCTHCNSGIALEGNVDSAFLPASGMSYFSSVMSIVANRLKPIVLMNYLTSSIPQATGCRPALKTMNCVKAMIAAYYLRD
jgi:hypothetical protein